MDSSLLRAADRYLVWLVAILASADAMTSAVQGRLDGRFDHVYLWGVASILMIGIAAIVETVKSRRNG